MRMSSEIESSGSCDTAESEKYGFPPDYKVILLNDDFTTKEFVVEILTQVFQKTMEEAVEIMEKVHKSGRGVAGVYTIDVAFSRVRLTHLLAKKRNYPLRCIVEQC